MRSLLTAGFVALASCGAPTKSTGVQTGDESGQVRLHVADVSGSPLVASASGPNVRCVPDGADLLCSVPGEARYPIDVSAPDHVTVPVWIGVATVHSGNSMPSPIDTSVAVSLWMGSGRFTRGACPPCPLAMVPITPIDAATGAVIADASGTRVGCTGTCDCPLQGGKLLCSAGGVGPLGIDVVAPAYAAVQLSVPVASFGTEFCCWGGTSVTVPLTRQ